MFSVSARLRRIHDDVRDDRERQEPRGTPMGQEERLLQDEVEHGEAGRDGGTYLPVGIVIFTCGCAPAGRTVRS
ncbi:MULTISPECIES: hypothetical protein [unclassified Pseudonocardia]|uniref:hypothetical protein n=1 Tax=unclassified Pseudonocardia TaxID=2619320 RepID=UPI001AD601DE|nr:MULTISPECIES: hypothetical protein [unclassified Pseudonocardia]MBN9101098.1 hypothetical protein [Pseudonocardia sp.]